MGVTKETLELDVQTATLQAAVSMVEKLDKVLDVLSASKIEAVERATHKMADGAQIAARAASKIEGPDGSRFTAAANGVGKLTSAFERAKAAAKAAANADKELFAAHNRMPKSLMAAPAAPKISGFQRVLQTVGHVFGQDAAAGLARGAARITEAAGRFGPAVSSIGSALSKLGPIAAGAVAAVAAAAAAAAIVVGKLTSAVVSMSIEAAGFKANTLSGLKAILGSKEAAEDTYKTIKKFADATPFETKDVATNFKGLLGAGFNSKQAETILKGVFDVAALNDFSTDTVRGMSLAIRQIKGNGKLLTEELNQVVENSAGTVGKGAVLEQLRKDLGMKTTDEVRKALEGGKIAADQGVEAILKVIRDKISGGELGSMAKEMSEESVTGLTSTIKSKLFGMFEGVNISPALDALKNVVSVLNGPTGDRIGEAVTRLGTNVFESLFGPFAGEDGAKRLERYGEALAKMLDKAASAAAAAGPYVEKAVTAFDALFTDAGGGDSERMKTFKQVRDVVATIASYVSPLGAAYRLIQGIISPFSMSISIGKWLGFDDTVAGLERVQAAWDSFSLLDSALNLASAAYNMGRDLVTGFVNGITSWVSSAASAAANMASSALSAAKAVLNIHSPSKAFEELGVDSGAGMVIGLDTGADRVANAGQNMARSALDSAAGEVSQAPGAVAQAAASAPPGGGGMPPVVINVNISAQKGVSQADAQAQGRAAGEAAYQAFRAHYSRFAREVSAA